MDPESASKLSPDGVLQTLLGLLGVNSLIIGLVLLVLAAQAWIGLAKSAIAYGPVAKRGLIRVSSMRPSRVAVSVLSTIVVPIAQVGSLWLCYLLANVISILFRPERQDRINNLISAHPELSYDASQPWTIFDPALAVRFMQAVSPALEVDPIAAVYLVAAVFLIGKSYIQARRSCAMSDMSGIGTLLGLPAAGMMLLSGIPLAFAFVVALFTGGLSDFLQFLPQLYMFLFCTICFLSFQFAVRGSLAVIRAWGVPDE